jgi:signal peptidase I
MAKRSKTPSKKSNVVAQARAGKPADAARPPLSKRIWENIKSLAGAVAIYLVIKTVLIEAFRIPSGSMIPSLLIGDWLFVNKLAYGPHVPFTQTLLPGYRTPRRGDVVVFESPYQADEAQVGRDPTPTLVKRLVAVPGDTLYMRNGLLHVNGMPQRQGFAADRNWKGDPNSTDPLFDWQHRIAAKGTRYGAPPATPTHDNWGPLIVPANEYFMMGDNRYCSKDSRYWGTVPRRNLRGRPLFVYYSYRPGANRDNPEPLDCNPEQSDRPLPFITDIRWGRIGDWIR